FDFFTIPNSYRKKTHLMNKMINPTLKELEEITGIKAQVEFYPKHNWHTLTLTFKRIQVISNSKKLLEKTLKLIPELNSLSDKLNSTVKKMMRNIYVSRAWNSSAENSIKKLIYSEGEEFTIKVLKSVYENLKTDVKKSLSLYIQGVVKKMKEGETEVVKKVVEKKPIIHKEEIGSPISYPDKQNEEMRNILFSLFENFDKEKQLDLEEKARKEYLSEVNQNEMNDFLEKSYKFSRKKFIVDEIIKLK
ncbi:MAG: hypothetical protein ACRC0Y_09085, partial [Fusobacteriaceae bacterium]